MNVTYAVYDITFTTIVVSTVKVHINNDPLKSIKTI